MSSEKGFTLLELVLVIMIIGIMLSIVVSRVRINDYAALRLTAQELISVFRKAKEMAKITQQRIEIQFDYENNLCSIINDTTKEIIEVKLLNEGVLLDGDNSTYDNDTRLVFNPTGTARSGSLFITDGSGEFYRIIVGGIGRIRLEH